MVVCKFFLKGNCKFGDRCYNEHVQPNYNNRQRGRGEYSSNRYESFNNNSSNRNFIQQPKFQNQHGQGNFSSPFSRDQHGSGHKEKNDKYHWSSSSNRSAPLNDFKNDRPMTDPATDDQAIIRTVQTEVNTWNASRMWPYSSYSCGKKNRCIDGLADIQPEELRILFYLHGADAYQRVVQEMDAIYSSRKQELLRMSDETRNAVLTNINSSVETNPSAELSIFAMYSTGTEFKSNQSGSHEPVEIELTESPADENTDVKQAQAPQSFKNSGLFTAEKPQIQHSLFKTQTPATQAKLAPTGSHTTDYTDESILTEAEIEQFKATSFTLGKIPKRPPPKSYCR